MSPIKNERNVASASAETTAHIARSRLSREQTEKDILASRHTIRRSLELLLATSAMVSAQRG